MLLPSCVKNSSEYKALQAQNDSLAVANAKSASELDDILSLLNEVEDNFNTIKSAENYLSIQSNVPGEMAPTIRQKVQSNMEFVTETLNKNKEKISELENKLKNSSLQTSKLQQTVSKLRADLDQKTAALVTVNEELNRKNKQISELSTNINNLSKDVQELKTQSGAQQQTINQQQKELNTVYYCFGTSKELKDQKIIVSGNLSANLNKEYFIKVSDLNKLQNIPLQAKKGKLISKHPEGSYEFTKDSDGKAELKILDAKNFWSLTKYLVIQVNV
jgi:chromosome segregation ATPase